MNGQIFISYRREDASHPAGGLYDNLHIRFRQNEIFMDVDSIKPGLDFVNTIEERVGAGDVLVAVIGKRWLSAADEEGRCRLDNPEDFVRVWVEIFTALRFFLRHLGIFLVGVSKRGSRRVWNAATGKALGEPMKHDGAVYSAQFSADGQRVVTTASLDTTARVWDAATGKALSEPMQHGDQVSSAQFSADGKRVVTASFDGTARVWDAATGKAIGEPMKHDGAVYSAQFSADEQRVVTASGVTAQLWGTATGKALSEPMTHDDWVNSAQFSADGQRVVTASHDKTARVWDAATGKALSEPMKHDGAVLSAQFSADGQRVVTASKDETAWVWDVATGKALSEPMKHDGWVTSAQFSADGQRVVMASADKTARVWDIPTITTKDSADDVNLLANLAEATAGIALQAFGQTETPDQVKAPRDKIAARFAAPSSNLTPLQRFLKWSVSGARTRTISPFLDLTVADWVKNRIQEGTLDDLRAAMLVDPENPRLAAHFGKALADHALEKGTVPDEARQARAEADTQTQRAVKLAPADDEVKTLRADVVKRLQLGSESPVLPTPAASHPPDDAAATPDKVPEGGSELWPKARGRHDHRPRPQPSPTFWQRLFGHKETQPGKPRP